MLTLILLQAAQVTTPSVPWAPRERTDATTGARSVTAGATSRERNARLSLRCDAQVPVVSIQYIPREPLGAGPDRMVSLSFDGGPAVTLLWEFPGTASFVRDPASVTALTIQMASAKTIRVEAQSTAGTTVAATFDGPGNDASIKSVLTACEYTLGMVPPPQAQQPK